MESMYEAALQSMEETLHIFADSVPAPQKVPYKESFVFRYKEKSIRQAMILKLARIISGLDAAWLLMRSGFIQEQGALQRILDELDEDVQFLFFAQTKGITQLHKEFLNAFWEEEFDQETAMTSTQRRAMIPRKKIRAYVVREQSLLAGLDPNNGVEASRTLSKALSGYVHAAAPHILDIYGGYPPRFHVRGMLGTPIHEDHRQDLWNNFFRGIASFGFAAVAFGMHELHSSIAQFSRQFEKTGGKDYSSL